MIERNYPQIKSLAGNTELIYANFLQAVVNRQAALIAQWMQLGFIHGVMNTDNMSIAGETIDYGPCAFMDHYAHNKVFSAIDRGGRYAYNNQPSIGLWNLSRLAETLLPLLAQTPEAAIEIAQDILKGYIDTYENNWLSGMRAKCGLTNSVKNNDDKTLIETLFETMAANSADFTLTFFHLSRLNKQITEENTEHEYALRNLFDKPEQLDDWLAQWRTRLDDETQSEEQRQIGMQAINPVYIPRNHQIEAAIRAAEDHSDFTAFHDLHKVLQDPYTQQKGKGRYQRPPKSGEVIVKTFCGT